MPKTITSTNHPLEGAWRKTGFSVGVSRSTAIISGRPARSEDPGEYKHYFNPAIHPHPSLHTSNPVFATAVNIRCHQPQNTQNTIETVHRCLWDNHPHGWNTRSQEALCRRAEKKVTKCYPCFKD